MSSAYVAVPVMLLLAVLQTAVLPQFPIFGLVPLLPLLVAIGWGLQRGVTEGAIWAFIGGLALDLYSVGPTGLTALTFVTAVVLVILMVELLPKSRVFLPAIAGAAATFIYLVLYLLGLWAFDFLNSLQTATALLPLIILHAGLVLPISWLITFIDNAARPRPVKL